MRCSLLSVGIVMFAAQAAHAQLSIAAQFGVGGGPVGLGFSAAENRVWAYDAFGASLRPFSLSGVAGTAIPRPGTSANDADIDVAPIDFTLSNTPVPAGSLLFIDGETGPAEVYATDTAGNLISVLSTQFGQQPRCRWGSSPHPRHDLPRPGPRPRRLRRQPDRRSEPDDRTRAQHILDLQRAPELHCQLRRPRSRRQRKPPHREQR